MHSVDGGTGHKAIANYWLIRSWNFLGTTFCSRREWRCVGKRLFLFLTKREGTGNGYAYVICKYIIYMEHAVKWGQ